MTAERVSVLVPAAGRGRRFHPDQPKLFADLNGEPVLARTLRSLQRVVGCGIQEIIVALDPDALQRFDMQVRPRLAEEPPVRVTRGGDSRRESVAAALASALPADVFLVHDGARPLLNPDLVRRCLEGVRKYGAVAAALPVTDTVKTADANGRVQETLPRERLWSVQTPQAFAAEILREAHRSPAGKACEATDDASLVERLGVPVYLVPGDEENLKITTPTDLHIAKALIAWRRSNHA